MYCGFERVSIIKPSVYIKLTILRTMPQVMVVSSEGYFYSYNIDLENGGQCSLMKQYRFVFVIICSLRFSMAHQPFVRCFSLLDSGDEPSGIAE
jgi:hypothetical protein